MPRPARVLVDGPRWSGVALPDALADALRGLGDDVLRVDTRDFLRPASVRLERGREDPDGYYEDWYDVAALRREVLEPLGPGGDRRWLPTLWDEASDRATRAATLVASPAAVLLVTGDLLLGLGLPAELTVHVALSTAARQRRAPAELAARELPALRRYETEVGPGEVADVVVLADDPRRLAVIDRRAPSPGRR